MTIRKYYFFFISFILLFHIILVSAAVAANKIMPLGDSITQGISSGVPDEAFQVSYRKALYDKLQAAGYVVNDEIFVGTLFSGESVPDFDPDHDGHSGWQADQIVNGHIGFPLQGKLDEWLDAKKPNIVLLHIGTNDISNNNENWTEVEDILDVIDNYEISPSGNAVWVILSLIIDRSCSLDTLPCQESLDTTAFNNDVETFVFNPRNNGGIDKIVLVDMQNGTLIDYRLSANGGDMWDDIHPFETGYTKMADLWWSGLQQILPLADAGPDQNVDEFETVTLDGSGSTDPKIGNGNNLSYQWVQTAGTPLVTLSDDTAVQPMFDAPDAGLTGIALTFTLTVTDDDELVSTDEVNVDVAKIVPQANAGTKQTVNESDIVTLDGSGSVGVSLAYQWIQTAGSTVTLAGAATETATFTAPDVGPSGETLTFELTVTDDDGIDSTDAVDVDVENIVQANAGPNQTVDESATVTLDASNSVGVGLTYQWTQTPTPTVTLSDDTAVQPTFTAPNVGSNGETLTFSLTITDANNLEDTDTVNINVRNPNSSDGGGGGGGGGGCFITTSGYGSSMAPGGNTSLVAPLGIPAATLELVAAMVAFISICAAIVQYRRRKRWIKALYS